MRLRGEEFTGRTVEEAIERGLVALRKKRPDVDIEVLEEGKPANMLGMGGEDARVLITFQEEERPEEEEEPVVDEAEVPRRPAAAREDVESLEEAPPAYAEELVKGADALREILTLMGIQADVVVRDRPPQLEIEGPELGVLIGRHGENLIALQQLVSLITSRRGGKTVYVAIDIEGYRERREEQLREIARRVAGRVRSTSQAVTLEPMLAYERRVVHLTLQDDPDVRTESVGVDPNRRVVVLPKRAGAPTAVRPGGLRPQRPFRPGPRPGFPRRPGGGGGPGGGPRPPYRRPFGDRPRP